MKLASLSVFFLAGLMSLGGAYGEERLRGSSTFKMEGLLNHATRDLQQGPPPIASEIFVLAVSVSLPCCL